MSITFFLLIIITFFISYYYIIFIQKDLSKPRYNIISYYISYQKCIEDFENKLYLKNCSMSVSLLLIEKTNVFDRLYCVSQKKSQYIYVNIYLDLLLYFAFKFFLFKKTYKIVKFKVFRTFL